MGQVDGVQLSWPLPSHIDALRAYESIPRALDVDGARYVGDYELGGGIASRTRRERGVVEDGITAGSPPPVTPASVLKLLETCAILSNAFENSFMLLTPL